ncbi:hypothetical protein FRC15_006212 [Serendipita sp. 397]|nr:hypothetical protein FRC15_006212 [Serendipita sp. 397]
MWIVRQVFRCFKCFERSVDRITGVVGPLFIAIAIVLISTGIVTFFDIIAPKLPFRIITTPICALIAFNTLAHYYWAITISPGFADDDVRLSGQRRHYPTSTWVLKMTAPTRRSSFGSEILPGHELENGRAGKCLKCGSVKPEVGNLPVSCMNVLTLVYSELTIAEYANVACLNMIIIALVSNHLLTQMGIVIACLLGINQCVGIGNERHFILFMVYLIICCVCFLILGFPVAWEVFDMFEPVSLSIRKAIELTE